jgi:nicotinamidase-related amidase
MLGRRLMAGPVLSFCAKRPGIANPGARPRGAKPDSATEIGDLEEAGLMDPRVTNTTWFFGYTDALWPRKHRIDELDAPALIVIDMTNDFLATQDALRRESLITSINDLVARFRAAGHPVIWVRQDFRKDLRDAFLEMRDRGIELNIVGTKGAELDLRLDVRGGDTMIVKKRYSPFFGTNLDAVLAQAGVQSLVIAGINTHACVRMAAIDAYQRDMRVIIASEAIDSYDEEHARVSLRYMDGKIARVLDSEAIMAELT